MNGAMRIYGLDFTSAPSSGSSKAKSLKKLMLAACTLENGLLNVDNFEVSQWDLTRRFLRTRRMDCALKGSGLLVWISHSDSQLSSSMI